MFISTNHLSYRHPVLGERTGLIGTNQNMIADRVIPTERTTPESFELYKMFGDMRDEKIDAAIMEVSSHS